MNIINTTQHPPTPQNFASYDALVVGAGFAGAVIARELAERGNRRVAVVERRDHIGGNAFDHLDEQGVLIHAYGPHIYHTDSSRVHSYLSRFTAWRDYQHEVLAFVRDAHIPVPFNLNSIAASFDADKAHAMTEMLLATFGRGTKVPIIDLRKRAEPLLQELAAYVYENVFLHYTVKQWGLKPEQIDPAVTARVPVLIDWDNRYFQDRFQGMPAQGYTPLFERLLDHPNIEVFVGLDARDLFVLRDEQTAEGERDASAPKAAEGEREPQSAPDQPAAPDARPREGFTALEVGGAPYTGIVVYTGALDELCAERFGLLPYRSLDFCYRRYDTGPVQPCGTVNFTVSEAYTRTTEYPWLTGQEIEATTVAEEYSRAYTDPLTQIPYYPILNDENLAFYERYRSLFEGLGNFYALGRLAQYRYYNMDQIVLRALELADELIN
ncbi:MAG: FAD-dependent oxidoreductase [Coriobacteriales bacterium]|jgi:UDP-galactopyranose mutase|nr:FAD-dependent oxidoreductase [Coriobacteriales bacterium]